MLPAFKRIESITRSLENALSTANRTECYRLALILLRLIVEHHKTLEDKTNRIQVLNCSLKNMPTDLVHREYYRTTGSYGRGGHVVGTSGNRLRTIGVKTIREYHATLTESVMLAMEYNEELRILLQYAESFSVLRSQVIELRPNNMKQRQVQLILARSQVLGTWYRDEIRENPILGVICGHFYITANLARLTHEVLKGLDDQKSKIGRFSYTAANELIHRFREDVFTRQYERYQGRKTLKNTRCDRLDSYVSNSPKYKQLLSWIVGLKDVRHALPIVRYAAAWKEQYSATDRLCRSVAARKDSYVKTLFCSQPVQCGTIRHLETDVPVYVADCIIWESRTQADYKCYYLGKTGSTTVDESIQTIDYYHQSAIGHSADTDQTALRRQAVDYLRVRLGYAPNQKVTLAERRKEIAAYARKLVWLETISMLDSKAAGNCLPGTLQFCQTLGIDVPSQWADVSVDARKLLRSWRKNGYGVNRLLLPAIDSAVNRVKHELLSVTACYVPSVVK